jgi:hypothetical protein
MQIDIGELKEIRIQPSVWSSAKDKLRVQEVTFFLEFDKIGTTYFTLSKADAKAMIKRLNSILDKEENIIKKGENKMEKKLTKRLALKICMELWQWLSQHTSISSGSAKVKWPGWKKYFEGGVSDVENECPCCEYAKRMSGEYSIASGDIACDYCPMKSLWGDDCTDDDSAYNEWWYNSKSRTSHKKYATEIYLAAKKAYEREMNRG